MNNKELATDHLKNDFYYGFQNTWLDMTDEEKEEYNEELEKYCYEEICNIYVKNNIINENISFNIFGNILIKKIEELNIQPKIVIGDIEYTPSFFKNELIRDYRIIPYLTLELYTNKNKEEFITFINYIEENSNDLYKILKNTFDLYDKDNLINEQGKDLINEYERELNEKDNIIKNLKNKTKVEHLIDYKKQLKKSQFNLIEKIFLFVLEAIR